MNLLENQLDENYRRMLRTILNKYWKHHPKNSSCTATYLPSHSSFFLRGPIDLFGLVWFYGISTVVGYLMPNPIYSIYIKYMICKQILLIIF